MQWPPFFTLDCAEAGLLPPGWAEALTALADSPERQYLHPNAAGPPPPPDEDWRYAVVQGDLIRDRCPWLVTLYACQMLDFARQSFAQDLVTASRLRSAITLNIMTGTGARLDWHHDHNPVSGLFFVTAPDVAGSGELMFRDAAGREAVLVPRPGTFVCFDASFDHCVTPLRSPALRLSVPMVYHASTTEQPAPYDIDIYQ